MKFLTSKIIIKTITGFFLVIVTIFFSCTPASAKNFSYISNGTIKIGVITDWGVGIGYFSRVSPERNLINSSDKGREVQQSYYGSSNGLTWNGTAWKWNPVQVGDAYGNPSTVQSFTNDGSTIYAKVIPKDWAANNVDIQGYMEETINFYDANTAHIHFKFTYTGSSTQSSSDQELPAVFVDYALPNLVTYRGGSPWTNGSTTSIVPGLLSGTSGATNFNVAEPWMAYVDGTNWGIGIFTPDMSTYDHTTSYLYNGGSSGPDGASCSYVAPVGTWSFSPTTGTKKGPIYEYDAYLTIGALTDIRSRFYAIHNGVVPPPDTTPPSVPTNLAPTVVSGSEIDLSWSASTDDVGVTGYNVYRNGTLIGTASGTTYQDTGLSINTNYSYYVKAYDGAGNVSGSSSTVNATTGSTATGTLGYSSIGSISDSYNNNSPSCSYFTMTNQTGTATSMSVYIASPIDSSPNNKWSGAIYNDSSGSPGSLIASTAQSVASGDTWNTAAISAPLAANTKYWECYNTNALSFNSNQTKKSPGAVNQHKGGPMTFGTWNNPFGTISGSSNEMTSLYVTYVISGSDTTPPAPPSGLLVQ